MKHLGDITKINGSEVPPVDVIIGGSPCQDLSVAGKRAGLAGERSGLFMEQIRIIKEMRSADEQRNGTAHVRPRYMVWENVPGAFSSNKGQDFRAVLEETARIVEKELPDIPVPEGGWHYSGVIMGNGFSIAWRVFDAQFWGVPQRRRRIALVADFGGCTAPEILFERKSVRGYTPPSGTSWKDFAAAVAERFGAADKGKQLDCDTVYPINTMVATRNSQEQRTCLGVGEKNDPQFTISAAHSHGVAYVVNQGGGKSGANVIKNKAPTLACTHGGAPAVYDARGNGDGQIAPTMTGDHQSRITDYTGLVCGFPLGFRLENTKVYDEKATTVCNGTRAGFCNGTIALDRAAFNQGKNAQYDFEVSENGVNSTLTAKGPSAVCESTVRRLTPLECERLQGFPDGWTDIDDYIDTNGKKHKTSDTARYKALGNSIALPSWVWVLERLSSYCGDKPTMASLFDGIGGFPLIWETLNGAGTCLWASEIEEFPIAVTKLRFGED